MNARDIGHPYSSSAILVEILPKKSDAILGTVLVLRQRAGHGLQDEAQHVTVQVSVRTN